MTAISESDAMALQVTDVTKHYDSGFTLDDATCPRATSWD